MSCIRIAVAGSVLLLAAGCATVPEEEFGSSVRHMIQVQTYNPDAMGAAPTDAGQGLDGEKAGSAVKAYREQKPANARSTSEPMRIDIGG
jgi:hypothetical protein